MPVIKFNLKALEVLRAFGTDALDQLLRRDAFGFGLKHDGRAMGIVSAHKVHSMASHAHGPYPNISLDIFHDVANVKRAIGVGQGGGDEQGARHGGR